MTVIVAFSLSPAGQRASLIAGGSGAARQTVPMDAEAADLASPNIIIAASGEMSLAVPGNLDVPPATLVDALAAVEAAAQTQKDAELAAEAAALAAVEAYENGGEALPYSVVMQLEPYGALRKRANAEKARREVRYQRAVRMEKLRTLAADADLAAIRWASGDRAEQIEALGEERILAAEATAAEARAKAKAEEERKATELAADVALDTRYFAVAGGLCEFSADARVTVDGEKIAGWLYGWAIYDERHWLGIFTGARGISRFLPGPRGEQCYDVRDVVVGECIQQASFSTNSRGKRRNENENFAVVVLAQPDRIGIHVCSGRAEALKFAAKL